MRRGERLVPDIWPAHSPCNLSNIGFALVAYGVGAERGWITRREAREITLTTLKFFDSLPMGSSRKGVAGYRGFYYHYLDLESGLRATDSTEISCIDVALLHLGFLFSAVWFDGDSQEEAEIRKLAHKLVNLAEWDWFQRNGTQKLLPMGWQPESGFNTYRWSGYSEAKGMYLLALGSENHPIDRDSWDAWTSTFNNNWRGVGLRRHLGCAPLFTHQYSEMWIDFRGIQDELMREAGFDYFENSRRATYDNRDYCIRNPNGWRGYGQNVWGLTGSNGPGNLAAPYLGRQVQFHAYAMRGPNTSPGGIDDGTIAPTGAISSIPFAPEICIPAMQELYRQYGEAIYGEYGFIEAFNPSFTSSHLSSSGKIHPVAGWVDDNYFSLDQGSIVGMIANYKSESVWRPMRRSAHLIRSLKLAKFAGNWLDRVS